MFWILNGPILITQEWKYVPETVSIMHLLAASNHFRLQNLNLQMIFSLHDDIIIFVLTKGDLDPGNDFVRRRPWTTRGHRWKILKSKPSKDQATKLIFISCKCYKVHNKLLTCFWIRVIRAKWDGNGPWCERPLFLRWNWQFLQAFI